MYKNITITGFSDEISPKITEQFEHLNKLGIEYFDPRGVDGVNISQLDEVQSAELKKKMEQYGIKVACIGSPIGKKKITDEFDPNMVVLKNTIRVAKELGTKYIRIFSFYVPEGEAGKYRDEVMRRMKKMTALAENEDIILLHENEKGIYGDTAKRCEDILKTVNSKSLGCIFDPANFVQCGEVVYPDAFNALKPFIDYLHIKDALADGSVVPAGMGIGGVEEVISSLINDGFSGFACLEPHLGSFEGLAKLELDDKMEKLPEGGEGTFTLAFNALKEIMERI